MEIFLNKFIFSQYVESMNSRGKKFSYICKLKVRFKKLNTAGEIRMRKVWRLSEEVLEVLIYSV